MSSLPHRLIEASAGSGKTYQLTNRYLALLASGVEPDRIVATTFTRKAAGEILDRVLARLAAAATSATAAEKLAGQIEVPGQTQADFATLLRGLLGRLHRLRINTIDAFNMALAGSYAPELGLPAAWSICEEADQQVLRRDALERLLDQQPEEITRLYALLNKGDANRSVHAELEHAVTALYQTFRESERPTWERHTVPPPVPSSEVEATCASLRDFDLSSSKSMLKARDDDLGRFAREDWKSFLTTGLAAKVHAGESKYGRQPIPAGLAELYEPLVRHVCWDLLRRLADQTRATRDLLEHFHQELWAAKRSSGALRFDEVTQAIVDAIGRAELRPEAVAFRLDGAIDHLLLDEFQDTSLPQWRVLEPFAGAIVAAPAKATRTFFCVGDVKQAIYRWRGGMAEILGALKGSLGPLEESPLSESHRSAQPVIDVVNNVFKSLGQVPADESITDVLVNWSEHFPKHTTARGELAGYVCLHTGPAQQPGRDQRGDHCAFAAEKIRAIVRQAPVGSVGVLCRQNETVARMIYELRQQKVDASEEGGGALTDSAAVELLLSLLTLADHPGHSVAWFHLQNSPLKPALASFADPATLAHALRRERLALGYGAFVHAWAKKLAPVCDRRDLARLQQLIEMAYAFQARSTLRSDELVAWVRGQRVPDPTAAPVRVMTIHAAKGLEFDVVVLPELDCQLVSQSPTFVVGRDSRSLDVNFVSRYAGKTVQSLLPADQRAAFEDDKKERAKESLCTLYVAMTRAIHALHIFIPGPRKPAHSGSWYNVLRHTLAPGKDWTEKTLLFEHGDAAWHRQEAARSTPVAPTTKPKRIEFRKPDTDRRRGLEHVAPSRREGGGLVSLDRLFRPSEGTGTAAGTLYHAWFETIEWLDPTEPSQEVLQIAAQKLRTRLPAETWKDLEKLLANFRGWLQKPEIRAVLQRSAYAASTDPGSPGALGRIWKKSLTPLVERERRFLIRDGAGFLGGSFDRIVWLTDKDQTIAADLIDFKTDDIAADDERALAQRTEHYRPQLEAYRRAIAKLGQLPLESVAARLVFTSPGRVVSLVSEKSPYSPVL